MKKTKQSPVGTSFHNTVIKATVSALLEVLGKPHYCANDGEDKVNYEWVMETDTGGIFTVYDWKEYRPIRKDELIEWHIGGDSATVTEQAKEEITKAIHKLLIRKK